MRLLSRLRLPSVFRTLPLIATAALAFAIGLGKAEAQEGKTVTGIDVQYVGSQTVSPERILSHMGTKVNDKLSLARIDDDIRALYASGDVERVRIMSEPSGGGVRLIVVAQTRAVYGGSRFSGNTLVSTSSLNKKVDLKVNQPIDEKKLQEAREEIQKIYRKKGFSEATVSYSIGAPTEAGYSLVNFNIDEGTQGVLRKIEFVGNSAFSSAKLKEQVSQKEKGVKTMFGGTGQTDPETMALEVQSIEDFYRDNGYLNARVVNVSRARVDAKYVDVVMTIDEGSTYQVGTVAVTGVQALSLSEDLAPYFKTKAGENFAGNKLKDDIKLIQEQYGRRGYADARVTPRLEEAGGGQVKVVLDVHEGKAFTLGQVHIESYGPMKTKEHVIRRELPLEPGQAYNSTLLPVTKRRLENMNYFSNVEVTPIDTSYLSSERDVMVRVTEKPTGTVNVGAGFSSIDSVTGFFELTQTNFDLFGWKNGWVGAGQRFRFSARVGNERRDVSVSFTEPWFLGHRLALTTEGFYRNLLFYSDQYEQTEFGADISLRKSLGEFTYGTVGYRPENVEIDPENNASPFFQNEAGDFFKSSLNVSVVRDTRDNVFLPRKGNRVSAGFEFAGLGGDVDDTIATVSASQYFTLPYDSILSFSGRFQNSSNGDHLFTRHFLGGANTLRAFDYRDVGPRDPISGETVGGNRAWYGTAEVTIPIVEKVRFATFYDVGEVSDGPVGSLSSGLHSDWGVGLRLFLLGNSPVRLDYAFPLQSDGVNDEGGRFQFTMGAQW